MPREVPRSVYLLLVLVLLVANIYIYSGLFAPPVLTVTVIPAGKGVATLLQTPRGKTVLVNTGPDASILRALGSSLPMWQRELDAVILTSDKKAFSGGLPDVIARYHVVHSYTSGSQFSFDAVSLTTLAPGEIQISYGSTEFSISSSTPPGTYTSSGKTVIKSR